MAESENVLTKLHDLLVSWTAVCLPFLVLVPSAWGGVGQADSPSFTLDTIQAPASTNVTVSWQSVAGMNYFLERSTNLGSPFMRLATNILGQTGTTSYGDTNAAGKGPFFYRVGVAGP